MRKLLVLLGVLLALLVAADRIGAVVAGRVVASTLRADAGLRSDPSVRIVGFPFLTQVLAGRYQRVVVRAKDVDRSGVRLSDLCVDLVGARIPVDRALAGSVSQVPVESLRGSVRLTYVDLVGQHTELVVTPMRDDLVRVTGKLTVLGATVEASSSSTLTLRGTTLVLTARSLSVEGVNNPLVDQAIAGRLDLKVPIGPLPFGLQLTRVHATSTGVVLDARSGPTVLRAR